MPCRGSPHPESIGFGKVVLASTICPQEGAQLLIVLFASKLQQALSLVLATAVSENGRFA
jgi:hypothetical protein